MNVKFDAFLFLGSVLTIQPESAVVLGMMFGKLEFIPVKNLIDQVDFKYSRPKIQWWMKLRLLLRALAKHDEDVSLIDD